MFKWLTNWLFGKADVNKDGQVNAADAKVVAAAVVEKVEEAAAPAVEKAAEAVADKATKVATKAKAKAAKGKAKGAKK